jgi:hypothetical protein
VRSPFPPPPPARSPSAHSPAAMQHSRIVTLRFGYGETENGPCNEGHIPNLRAVRAHARTHYHRVEGIGGRRETGLVSDLPKPVTSRFATVFRCESSLCTLSGVSLAAPADGSNLTGLAGREQLAAAQRVWLDPVRALLRTGEGGRRAVGLGYTFTGFKRTLHPPQVGGWFGLIVNSKGLLQFKAKVLPGFIESH